MTTIPAKHNLLDYILQHATIGITLADALAPDYPLVYVNSGFCQITGYSPTELIGRNCRFLQEHDDRQPAAKLVKDHIANGLGCRVVLRNYRKNGSMFWNEVTLIPIYNTENKLTHYMGIQYDVTTQTQYNELQLAYDVINEQLQNIQLQSEELRVVNERLKDSNARINEVATLLAHDLEEPALAMLSFVDLLRDTKLQLNTSDRERYASAAYHSAERVLPMIQKLVDIGKLARQEEEPIRLSVVNISRLVELVASIYRFRAESQNIQMELDVRGSYSINAEETMMFEVLDNLISHALTHTPHGKRIGVKVYTEPGGCVRIEVWDEGTGFTEAEKATLFTANGILSAQTTRGESTTGLGMVAVSSLVKRMRGRVWCESERGKGTQVFVEFPLVDFPLVEK